MKRNIRIGAEVSCMDDALNAIVVAADMASARRRSEFNDRKLIGNVAELFSSELQSQIGIYDAKIASVL